MASILVATGFVRIDADTSAADKALKAFGAVGAQALTTTLLPATAAVATGLGAVASAAAVATAAMGAYGAAVAPQFKQIAEASQKQQAAEDAKAKSTVASAEAQRLAKKYGYEYGYQVKVTSKMTAEAQRNAREYNAALSASQSATKTAQQNQALYKQELAGMPPATRQTAEALAKLKDAQKTWSDSLSASTMPLFTRGIEWLTRLLPRLTPVVRDVAQELGGFVSSLRTGVAGQVFQQFGQNVTTNGAGALRTFLNTVRNLTVGFVGLLNTFMPVSTQVTGGLEQLTEKFALWGATSQNSPGLQRMMEIARDSAPAFQQLASAVADVVSAAGPLAGVGLKVLTILAQIVEAIPTPVLKLLVPAIIAVNLALKAYAIYQAAATAATWLFATSVTASTGTVYASRAALVAHRIILIATAVATGIATAATTAWTIATRIASAAMLAFRYVLVAVRLAVVLTAAGFRILAVAMLSNPIGLIITGLVLLGVAFVVLWKKSETFRNIVKGAWEGIKVAAKAVADWFMNTLVPFFKMVWDNIYKYYLRPLIWYWTVAVPNAAKFLWSLVVRYFSLMWSAVKFVWDTWQKVFLRPFLWFYTQALPNAAKFLWQKVTGFFTLLYNGVLGTYNVIKNRVFSPLGNFFTKTIPGWAQTTKDRVVGFFRDMASGIGTMWSAIKNKTKEPINWVIKNVWNNGILSVWKKITGWIGLSNKLGTIKLLASGGTVGPARPGMFNKPTAIVGEGNPRYPEYVIPTDPKYAARAKGLWQAAGAHFMEDGGILGKIGGAISGAISSVADFVSDPLGKAKKLFNGPLDRLKGLGSSAWTQMVSKFPRMAVDGLLGLVKDAASGLIGNIAGAVGLGGGGGAGVERWRGVVQMALRQVGQPPAYTDITLRRMNQESGGNPTAVNKWDINWQRGYPSVGLMQVIRPTFQSHAGPYRKTGPFLYGVSTNPLANIYASMRYALAAYGSLPRAYNRVGGYANGTAGTTSGMHLFGEAGPELGFTPAGWRILNARQSAGLVGRGLVIERLVVENHGVIGSQYEVENWLVATLTDLKRKGRV